MTSDPNSEFDTLKGFQFFKEFPESYVRLLAAVTTSQRLKKGSQILSEGQMNYNLYFLVSGTVSVMVGKERVAILDRSGDILGEISVITSKACSASIVAESDVEIYAIESADLNQVLKDAGDDFAHYLYKTYAMILTEKLVITNEKARNFEKANSDLVGAQQALEEANRYLEKKVDERTRDLVSKTNELENYNAELIATQRKLQELIGGKEQTYKKLVELQDEHLGPLRDSLMSIGDVGDAKVADAIRSVGLEVQKSLEMIAPVTQQFSAEQAIRSKRVLLAESNKKQQVVAKLALGGTGVDLDIVGSFAEGAEKIAQKPYDLVFLSADLAALSEDARRHLPNAQLVFMAATEIPEFIQMLKRYPHFNTIVSRDELDRTFTVKNIMTTVSKLISRDVFGLEKYLIWGVDIKSAPITRSDERADLSAKMMDHFKQLGVRGRIIDRCATVAEELLMNAIYDAPVDAEGHSLYNHLDRKQGVVLKPRECGEFRYAVDGMLAAISVSDPFGGFKVETLMQYLERNYSGAGSPVQVPGKAGAGRGLHQIVENSDLVVFNVRRQKRTEVIALFNLDPSKQTEDRSRSSFHFFTEG